MKNMSAKGALYKILPDIKSKIEKKLKELRLKPKSSVEQAIKEKKHFFNSICYTKSGKKVFLKILLQKEKRFFLSILREIKISKFLTKNSAFKELNIPSYLDGDPEDSIPWFIHKYVEGDIIGDFYEIYPKYQNKKYITKIINNLKVLQSVPDSVIKKIKKSVKEIEVVNYKFYPKIVQGFQKNVKGFEIDSKRIYKFLSSCQNLSSSFKKVITHGDFTLANHIVSENEIYLTDWEWVRLDNMAADIAHLWLQTWRYPKWRNNLLLTFLSGLSNKEKQEFKMAFRLTVIIQALGEIRWNAQICKKKYKKGVISTSKEAIKNAVKDFNYFIN